MCPGTPLLTVLNCHLLQELLPTNERPKAFQEPMQEALLEFLASTLAPRFSRRSTTWSCPLLVAEMSGVQPSSSDTDTSAWPVSARRETNCKGRGLVDQPPRADPLSLAGDGNKTAHCNCGHLRRNIIVANRSVTSRWCQQ